MHCTFLLAVVLFMTCAAGSATAQSYPSAPDLPRHAGFPDPLVMRNGERVESAEQWRQRRRPELMALFQHYMYGVFPEAPKNLTAQIDRDRDLPLLDGLVDRDLAKLALEPIAVESFIVDRHPLAALLRLVHGSLLRGRPVN